MRQVGDSLDRAAAERFARFLAGNGMEVDLREEDHDLLSVWILDDDALVTADGHYARFRANPDSPEFDVKDAPLIRESRVEDRARFVDVRSEIFQRRRTGTGSLTMGIIIACAVLGLVSASPNAIQMTRVLYFSEYHGRGFPEILDGQLWRLITPIFLHGGILHLVFNMLWLYQLGGAVERNEGPRYLGIFIILTAMIVNTSQYLVSGPLFIGMSGVVYALLGYVWMMSRYEAMSRYVLHPHTVGFMVIWLVICLVGIIPNVANTQHVVGFGLGTAWGFLRSGHLKTLARRRRFRGD